MTSTSILSTMKVDVSKRSYQN